MKQIDLLYLLLPYAFVLIWMLRRYERNGKVIAWLLVVTMLVMWAVFYAALYSVIIPQDPNDLFAPITPEAFDARWFWIDTWNRHSPLIVLIYFGLCYSVAWIFRQRKFRNKCS